MATPYNDQWHLERSSDIATPAAAARGSVKKERGSARVRIAASVVGQADRRDVAVRSYLLRRWPYVFPC
jgi:hypothetical protein